MTGSLALAVGFTGHPEMLGMIGGAALVAVGAFWPGPRSAWSRLRRHIQITAVRGPSAAQPQERKPHLVPGAASHAPGSGAQDPS